MPKLLKTPFAIDAAEGFRTDIQESTGAAPNSATYQVGFPPVTMQSIASNGMPPKGSDLNGVLYDITDNLVFLTQGGGYGFDSAYATSIGGYPLNARLRLANGDIVKSIISGNTNDPNVDTTGWFLIGSDKVSTVESVADLSGLQAWDGRTVRTKSYRNGLGKGGALYIYDSTKASINNNVTIINGWVLQDKISVYRAGGYGDGVTDDTTYFQRAIDYSAYNKRNVDSSIMNNLLPASANIVVDSGNYVLSDYLKTRGNMIVWDTADNVNFVGADNANTKYLCGLVKRGDKISRIDNLGGTYDVAAPLSIINNAGKERSAGLQGYPAPHLIQKYDGGEQVGIFIDTHVDNPFIVSSGDITYTGIDSCTITNVTPALYAKLTVGTPIITQHSTPYKGQVKSIEYVDATTLTITLWGFYLSNPDVSDADATYDRVQPPQGFGCYVGYLKSAFGANITAWNENTVGQSALCGIELDIYNQATDEDESLDLSSSPYSSGYYMAALGTKYIKTGFLGAFGKVRRMFFADSKYGQIDIGFLFRANASTYASQSFFKAVDVVGNTLLDFKYNGLEFGDQSKAGINVIDFHTSGTGSDYDVRFLASGGSSSSGTGALEIVADAGLTLTGSFRPSVGGNYNIGSTQLNFKDCYLQNAVTVVSDERRKAEISELTEQELQCAIACGKLYRKYKLNTAIDEKGVNGARYHIGVIAQEVVQCFTDHNLDWRKYGIITYEKWDAIEAVKYQAATYDENDQELTPEIQAIAGCEAGEIYMVRYDELNCFINAGLEYRLSRLE